MSGEKKRCKLTVKTQPYLCANQLHISAVCGHHQAERMAVSKNNYNTCTMQLILYLDFTVLYYSFSYVQFEVQPDDGYI
jgi:hypothetical protein